MEDADLGNVGFVAPVNPCVGSAFYSQGFDQRFLEQQIENSPTLFVHLSAGVNDQRVIIRPDMAGETMLEDKILKSRALNREAAALVRASSSDLSTQFIESFSRIKKLFPM